MNILRRRNKKAEQRLKQLIETGDVPSFPNVVAEAIQLVSSPTVDLRELADTISADPKLTVSILKLANSPSFAPRSPITSVQQAAVLLGRNQLEALLITTGVADAVPSEAGNGYSPQRFWATAAHRAPAAAAMAAMVDPASQYDQFTAALLQDMAQPILILHDPVYASLAAKYGDDHHALAAVEEAELGWTHQHMGEILAEQWGLPGKLASSVGAHHGEPEPGLEIAQWAAYVEGPDTDPANVVAEAHRRLGVDEATVLAVLAQANEKAAEMARIFN